MTNAKYEHVWQIMKENTFEVDLVHHRDFQCVICKNILINARSSSCGCRFCLSCILTYLNGEERNCPSRLDDCKNQVINQATDLQIDHAINNAISKLVVKCCCGFQDEIRQMEDHMRKCSLRSEKCPYFKIGCIEYQLMKDKISGHMVTNNGWHSNLFGAWIENLRNELETIAKAIDKCRKWNLDKQGKTKLKKFIDEQEKLESLKQQAISCHQNKTFDKLHSLFKQTEDKRLEMTLAMKNSQTFSSMDHASIMKDINTIEKSVDKMNSCRKNIGHEFIWQIEKFNQKIKYAKYLLSTEIASDSFYSHENGYRFRLYGYPNGFGNGKGEYFSVIFRIIKGQFDNDLPWPMKGKIRIDVINQDTNDAYVSQSYEYLTTIDILKHIYFKPNDTENRGYGTSKFIKIGELTGNSSLIKDNRLMIKCSFQF